MNDAKGGAGAKLTGNPDDYKMPLMEHLVELRKRLLWSFVAFIACTSIAMFFASDIFNFLARPLLEVFKNVPAANKTMIYTSLLEKFFTNIKIGMWAGFFVSFPVFAFQIWLFVAPGLYKNEQHAFLPFLIAAPILFFAGGAFVYFLVFPVAWQFFSEFEQFGSASEIPIQMMPKVSEYLSLVLKLIFAFGICFQTPVVLGILAKAGLASAQGLAQKRRYAIVLIFVIAAIITPPDVISQLALAIPMCVLYEVGILIAKRIEKKRAKAEAEFEAELRGEKKPG
jgi:sec-independent protein translocase protein TatC